MYIGWTQKYKIVNPDSAIIIDSILGQASDSTEMYGSSGHVR